MAVTVPRVQEEFELPPGDCSLDGYNFYGRSAGTWRNLAQILVGTAAAASRALSKAVKDEMLRMKEARGRAPASTSSGAGSQTSKQENTANYVHGMTLQEATQILNVTPDAEPSKILERYNHLFTMNEKAKGGSFYIQSKVYRARERIEAELQKNGISLRDFEEEIRSDGADSDSEKTDGAKKRKSDGS